MKDFNVAEWSIKHVQIVFFFILAILVGGLWSYFNLGRSEDPNFTIRTMVITVAWPGASPEQIVKQVTDPLEKNLQDTRDLDYIKSFTHDGKTVIYVYLKDSVPASELQKHWTEVRNSVEDMWSQLPSGVVGPYINDRFDDVYGTIYAVTGGDYSYEEKRKYAEDIRQRLLRVPDVQRVQLLGVQQQMIYVEMNQDKLASMGISPDSIFRIIQQQGTMMPSGTIHTDTRNVAIRVEGLLGTPEALENLPIHVGNQTFHLGDIAQVKQTYTDPASSMMYYDGKPAIGIAVSMTPGGNNLTLGANLQKAVEEMKPNLPLGLNVSLVADQPKVVNDSISEFTESLIEAIVIVMAASFISLGMRSGVVLALCIPVVVCGSFLFMEFKGIDLQRVSLGALIVSLGILVDDAIIVIEMMQVKLEQGYSRMEAAQIAYRSCAASMLAGTLITIAGFIPVGFAPGKTAEYTNSLFWVIGATLLISWLASLFVSPVLGYKMIRVDTEKKKKGKLGDRLYQIFDKTVRWCIRYKRTVMLATAGGFVMTMLLIPLVKQEFFPDSVRPEIIFDVELPSGASIQDTQRVLGGMADMLYGDNRVSSFASYIGESAPRFILLFDPKAPDNSYGQMIIVASDQKARDSLRAELTKKIVTKYPSVRVHSRLIQTGPPADYPVMFRISANTQAQTVALAQKALAEMRTDPRIRNASIDWPQETPSVKVTIDQDKVRALGIDNYEVSRNLYVQLSGYKVSESYQGDQLVPISFKLEGDNASRLDKLATLPIYVGNGRYAPLGTFADISYENEISTIWRRNLQPTITLSAEVIPGAKGDTVASDLYNNTFRDFREHLPESAALEKGGTLELSEESLQDLMKPLPLMIFFILAVLMFDLQDIPKMVMAAITGPLGLIGAILTLLITRQPIGFMSIIGMIAISGMVIRNSIILLDQIKQHLDLGMTPYEAVVSSAALRFRPIMLSSGTDLLGMVPLIPNPFWAPMAVSFIGGLMLATAIGLLVLPAMYCWWYKIDEPQTQLEEADN